MYSILILACADSSQYCSYWQQNWGCSHGGVGANCKKTCNLCGSGKSQPNLFRRNVHNIIIIISIVLQLLHVQQFFLGTCSDSNEDPWRQYCSSWINYCSSHTGVRANCKKTCNLCDGDGGRKEIIL